MDDEIGVLELLTDNALGIIGALLMIWALVFMCVGIHRVATGTNDEVPTS